MPAKEKWKTEYRILRISRQPLEVLLKALEVKGFTYILSVKS